MYSPDTGVLCSLVHRSFEKEYPEGEFLALELKDR